MAKEVFPIGNVIQVPFAERMKQQYMEYAKYVINDRAVPDIRDGLKPVHRRILYGMNELKLTPTSKHKKSAKTVGFVLGAYHPHSDSSVYDAMVNLAQDFNMRYPLVDGRGNFGSLDRDPAASMRYSESRLSHAGELMLKDVDKNTVPMKLNYDETEYEPEVLPTLFPALLANPTTGIAVGLTSSFLPHNVKDVYQAIDVIFKNLLEEKETSIDEVIDIIKAPDFPTGGEILGYADAIKAYKEGHGKVILRGKYHTEDKKNKILIVFD